MAEAVAGLFDNYDEAKRAVHDLEAAGVPHDAISVVANNAHGEHGDHDEKSSRSVAGGDKVGADAGKGAGLGTVVGGAGGLLAGLGALAIPGLGPIVALGWLASTAAGAAVGSLVGAAGGGLVGALTHAGVSDHDAHAYAEGVRRGGTLVTARVDGAHLAKAQSILMDHSRAVDIRLRGDDYRSGGWSRFDDQAAPMTANEIVVERQRLARR